jgi:aerobic-type carbon monoxide dehydrogenase small subunit (CoxS/CutS family)
MSLLSACEDGEITKTVTNNITSTVVKTTTVTTSSGTGVPTITAATPTSTENNTIKLTVNGQIYEVRVNPEWSLQHLLHEELGWTDVKDMCTGYGACGSCTVILEGRPVLSCMALAIECDGMNVQTAQGIAISKHPIIESYTKYHTWQCGYCRPGFVVTAKICWIEPQSLQRMIYGSTLAEISVVVVRINSISRIKMQRARRRRS